MPLSYEADCDAHIARITGTGDVTFEECLELLELQRNDVELELHMLLDYRDAVMRMTVAQSADLAHRYSELYASGFMPASAVIAAPGVGFGMARAFESNLEESEFYRIFTDAEEAEAWLRERIVHLRDATAGGSPMA